MFKGEEKKLLSLKATVVPSEVGFNPASCLGITWKLCDSHLNQFSQVCLIFWMSK